jgi:uncharacterized protein YqeY
MNLEERLVEEMKQAMKDGDKARLSVIRMIRSTAQNKEFELRRKLTEEDLVKVIQGMVKKAEESIEQFQAGGRQDLVDKESREVIFYKAYLPESLGPEEVARIVDETIQETGAASARDMGKVMKAVMAKVAGRADGKLINQIVKERLAP